MKNASFPAMVWSLLFLVALIVGCNPPTDTDEAPPANESEEKSADSADTSSAEMDMPASTEVSEALEELPPEERKLALEQEICPVTEAKLGSMGKPYQIEYEGETVFFCCSGCESTFREDPEKYLAKISD